VDIPALITLLTAIGALIGAIYAIWRGIKVTPHEVHSIDAATVKTLIEASRIIGDQAKDALNRCDEMAKELEELERKTRAQEIEICALVNQKKQWEQDRASLMTEIRELYTRNFDLKRKVKRLEYALDKAGIGVIEIESYDPSLRIIGDKQIGEEHQDEAT
jgi:predicted RNase H-like nuclease (RuvC/YqgF family)